jgi:cytochrome c oxidase assembly protein subunit 15
MAVPDWPLSFGQWMPQMVGGVAWEHGHRMIGALVGLIIVGLAGWSWRREGSPVVRGIAWAALAGVLVQGLLGGLGVLWGTANHSADTHPVYSSVHGVLAMVLLSLVLTYTLVTAPGWARAGRKGREEAVRPGLDRLAVWLVAAVFVQISFGAVIRQFNAGLVIPDFPLSLGKIVPDFNSWLIAVAYAHRVGALVVAVLGGKVAYMILNNGDDPDLSGWVRRPAAWLALVLVMQVALGAATVLTQLNEVVATLHHAGGTAVLALSVTLALRLGRLSGALDFESHERRPT